MATTNDTNDTNQATFDEFETEDENEEFEYDAGTRAARAMSDFMHVEKGEYSEAGYRVHSGSGETYAVDLEGPGGYFCQCEDRADVCKHIMRVLIFTANGELGPGEEKELVTDGGEEDDTPEFPLRGGVPCCHRMSAAIELALRWEIEYEEAKAFLREIGFYGDVGSEDENAGKELVTDGGESVTESVSTLQKGDVVDVVVSDTGRASIREAEVLGRTSGEWEATFITGEKLPAEEYELVRIRGCMEDIGVRDLTLHVKSGSVVVRRGFAHHPEDLGTIHGNVAWVAERVGCDENAGKELVTDGGQEIHRDYRSGSKLSGELTDEFGSLETHSSSGDRFVVSHEGFMGDKITEMAAKHGFRVAYIGTALVEFTRIEGHHTDPRTDAGDGNAGREIATDGGREFDCSVCDAPMEFERVRDGNDGPVVESEEFRCDNGHRGVRNYGPLGHFIQSINLKESSGGKELITDGGIDLPPICPVEPERRNEHDEPICDECGMVVVDRENSEFGGACLCQGCRDGYYNELEREFGEELISGGD